MFKFKGISSTDMQVVIEEEEHFIARAAKKYETIEIEGRDGAIFNELGYSYVERPIYVQCLNTNKIDEILAWLDGEGEFEYKGRKTTARFYTILEPKREACIKIIDTTFIRDPFWNKANEEYQTVKESKIKTVTGNPIHIADSTNLEAKLRLNGGDKQETREGSNYFNINDLVKGMGALNLDEEDFVTVSGDNTTGNSQYYNVYTNPSKLIKPNAKYYLVLEIKEITGTGNILPHSFSETNYRPQFSGSKNYSFASLKAGDIKIEEITSLENLEDSTSMIRTFLSFNTGQSGSITFRISVLEEEPTADKFEYEQYGAMPSPEYPSKIETVGSNVNLFDKDNANKISAIINGQTKQIANFDTCKTIYIACLKNTTYTISRKIGTRFVVGTTTEVPNNGITCNQIVQKDTSNSITIATTENDNYLAIFYYNGSTDTLTEQEILDSIKIEKGTKATPYSPYGMGSVEIDVVNNNLFIPTLYSNNTKINQSNAVVTLEDDTFIFECTGGDMWFGNIISQGNKYTESSGKLIPVYNFSTLSVKILNELFAKNFLTCFDENLISLGYKQFNSSNILNNYSLPEGTKYVTLRFGMSPSVSTIGEKYKTQVQIEPGELTDYIPHQSQTKIMPIQQEMLEGDYIEDVEHHGWNKIVLTGNESYGFAETSVQPFRLNLSDAEQLTTSQEIAPNVYCSHFIPVAWNSSKTELEAWITALVGKQLAFGYRDITTLEDWKAYLAEQYTAGTPVTIYYKLATPIDLELTEGQKEAQKINTYNNVTNIVADNSLATLDVEYMAETTEKIINEGNIYSEPIIRLEKTQTEAVELTINNIRFKYNFNNDEYVEINCEKKTVEYEGLTRNRQIEIGYDFPKLKTGQNDIIMHTGDCIIKVLRKDRWL